MMRKIPRVQNQRLEILRTILEDHMRKRDVRHTSDFAKKVGVPNSAVQYVLGHVRVSKPIRTDVEKIFSAVPTRGHKMGQYVRELIHGEFPVVSYIHVRMFYRSRP